MREVQNVSKEPETVKIEVLDGPCEGMRFTLTMQDCVINYESPMLFWGRYRYVWTDDREGLVYVSDEA